MKYVTENGTEILNKTAEEIATELGVSEETAKLL
jgi:DNA-binding MurR/RpiR family transcriptional regulator